MNDQQTPASPLFPKHLRRAPLDFWESNRLSALIFLGVNLVFGTMGLWLPSLNTIGSASNGLVEFAKRLEGGEVYIFSITFLCAVVGTTFTSLAKDNVEHSRSIKLGLTCAAGFAFLFCVIFLEIQLLQKPSGWPMQLLQLLCGVLIAVIAVYIHSIVSIEVFGSAKSDTDKGAQDMLDKAKNSGPDNAAWEN